MHRSVWNADEIEQMLRHAEAIYRINSGQIDLPKLERFIVARVREHCQAVRGAIQMGKPRTIKFDDLDAARGESKKLWEQLKASTLQRCFIYRQLHEGTGRAGSDLPVTVRAGRPQVVNAMGDWTIAPDDAKIEQLTNQMPYEKAGTTGQTRKRNKQQEEDGCEKDNRASGANERKRIKKDFSNSQCVRCGKVGHRYLRCDRPWISIPRGSDCSRQMKLVALNARAKAGIKAIRFENPAEAEADEIALTMKRLQLKTANGRNN